MTFSGIWVQLAFIHVGHTCIQVRTLSVANLYIVKEKNYLHETVSPANLKDVGIVLHFDSKWGV